MRPFSQRGRDALYGISPEKVAELCGVHITTARRWKRYGDAPLSALKVLRLWDTGDLAAVDPAWSGWKIRGGELHSPDGEYSFTPGNVQAIPFLRQLIRQHTIRSSRRCPTVGLGIRQMGADCRVCCDGLSRQRFGFRGPTGPHFFLDHAAGGFGTPPSASSKDFGYLPK